MTFPLPGNSAPGGRTVIASVWYTEDPPVATVLLLNPAVPFFAVGQVDVDTGELIGDPVENDNIVPAVREYEDMGGDY